MIRCQSVKCACVGRRQKVKRRSSGSMTSARTHAGLVAAHLFSGAESHHPYRCRGHDEHGADHHRLLVLRHLPAGAAASLHWPSGLSDPPRHFCARPAADSAWYLAQATKSARKWHTAGSLPGDRPGTARGAAHPGVGGIGDRAQSSHYRDRIVPRRRSTWIRRVSAGRLVTP